MRDAAVIEANGKRISQPPGFKFRDAEHLMDSEATLLPDGVHLVRHCFIRDD